MITKICLNNVASYKNLTTLETDKKVNLIYGLNGTGKSTLSNYLRNKDDVRFKDSSIEGLDDSHEVLVYNQTFIQENFHEPENLKGIFTLSIANKDAATKIEASKEEIKKFEIEHSDKCKQLDLEKLSISQKIETAKNAVWKIKADYSGGDRVLEYCLDGYKSAKESLFNYLIGIAKPSVKPTKSIDELKADLQSISGENSQKCQTLPVIPFNESVIEAESIFSKQIIGNENSSVAELIKELGNSDWVKSGIHYLPKYPTDQNSACPFCQEKTISKDLIESINSFFDASYESDISKINGFLRRYESAILAIPSKNLFEENPKFEIFRKDFELKYNELLTVLNANKSLIEAKIKTPSIPVLLHGSTTLLAELNDVISKINEQIIIHNRNIDQKENVKLNIKLMFWQNMRWNYDQTVNAIIVDNAVSKTNIDALESAIKECKAKIDAQNNIIAEQQKTTVNIEEAIRNINNGLIDLGITDFKIKNHSENFYRIVRGESAEKIFRSLSEGEKMIISFLYFLELCRGKKDAAESTKKKIIVIDDPISSLSHIYVFNIGRLIKNEFFGKKEKKNGVSNWNFKYEQVFVLTHSLYFFYEITVTKHDERKEMQKLVRLSKNENGSSFLPMSYEEIQNDYQAYWYIIKDENQPKALVANCMRNVIEYFFNFVEKKDLNNFFIQEPLQSNRFQAFYRYINRESHSLGQNIFDFKEFDYSEFKDAFATLFQVAGYEDHYNKMIN